MLVLTRKAKEIIQIGNDIQVSVKYIRGNRVRIGIVAPDHVQVTRPDAKKHPQQFVPDTIAAEEQLQT